MTNLQRCLVSKGKGENSRVRLLFVRDSKTLAHEVDQQIDLQEFGETASKTT